MSFRIEADGDNAVERVRNALQGQDDDDIDSIVIEIEYGESDDWEHVLESEIIPEQSREEPANGLQSRFVEAVDSNPGLSVAELAEEMGEPKDAISPVASKVWKKGLVERTNSVPYNYTGITEWGREQITA